MGVLEGYLKRAKMLFFYLTTKKSLKTENGYQKKKKRLFQGKLDHRQISQYIFSGLQLKKKNHGLQNQLIRAHRGSQRLNQ